LINNGVREIRELPDKVQYPALESAVTKVSEDMSDAKLSLSHGDRSCRMRDTQNKHLTDTKKERATHCRYPLPVTRFPLPVTA
jgi:hypothetical protein